VVTVAVLAVLNCASVVRSADQTSLNLSLQNENSSGAKIDAAPTGTGFDVKRFYLSLDHCTLDPRAANV
jgi:hypothetical protein